MKTSGKQIKKYMYFFKELKGYFRTVVQHAGIIDQTFCNINPTFKQITMFVSVLVLCINSAFTVCEE